MAEIMGIPLSNVTNQHESKATVPNLTKSSQSPLSPIIGVRLKKTSSEIVRSATEQRGGGGRGVITEISKSAIKNAVEILTNAEPELNSMIVVTYPQSHPTDGRVVKAHLKSLRQAIERKYGDFEYFAAVEYQRRKAPHIHMALSIDLSKLGEVVTLKRTKNGRRFPIFQTVKKDQDWLFATWQNIITKQNPAYNGERLDWEGIDENDTYMAHRAYFEHNSAVSWELCRDKDGAKKYMVKELSGLSGLKDYQKRIPEGFSNPGRHFLYSPGMKYDDKNALEFQISESELRTLLELSDWKYLPAENKPLFKRLWNSAENLLSALIDHGFEPVSGSMESLHRYADGKIRYWADRAISQLRILSQDSELKQYARGVHYAKKVKAKIIDNILGDFVLPREPIRDKDPRIAELIQEFNEFVADWNSSVPVG